MNFLKTLNQHNLIAAHRGAKLIAPENTLSSMKASIGHCDFIEIDVQLSSDGVAIIIHDETLERTTNLNEPYKVTDMSFKELSSLDYGSWFNGKKEPILTLNEALKFIKNNNLFLNIEIKDMHKFFGDEKVVSIILKEIKAWHVENLMLISSFRYEYLSLCKERIPKIPTALLIKDKYPERLIEYLKELKVEGCHISDKLVSAESIKKLKEADFFVNVYTVNNLLRKKELFDIGVNGIFTDSLE